MSNRRGKVEAGRPEGDIAVVQAKEEKWVGSRWEEEVASGVEVRPRGLADGLGVGMGGERSQGDAWAWSDQGDGAVSEMGRTGRRGRAVGSPSFRQGHMGFEIPNGRVDRRV